MTSTQDQTAMAKDLCDAVGPVLGSYPGQPGHPHQGREPHRHVHGDAARP